MEHMFAARVLLCSEAPHGAHVGSEGPPLQRGTAWSTCLQRGSSFAARHLMEHMLAARVLLCSEAPHGALSCHVSPDVS